MVITCGVQNLGEAFVRKAFHAVRTFDAFAKDNDPWSEHDFGVIQVEGEKIFFKIDYYDKTLTSGSQDPADEALTTRVLTIMLASEY